MRPRDHRNRLGELSVKVQADRELITVLRATRCGRRSALAIFAGCAAAVASGCSGLPGAPRARADGADIPRYSYGEDPSQYAEMLLPAGSAPAPVVVIVHGGYWRSGYGAELGQPLAADLVKHGFATVNVEYRRVGGGGGWPQTGQDVAAAVDALGTAGQQLAAGRLDLNRVAGLGHSAGGQLVGWLAARRSPAVALTAVVLQAGVLDLVRAADEGLGGGAVADFLGGTPTQVPDVYADASPIARLPLRVPSVCVHGRQDTTVPIDQSRRFVAAARQAGDDSELREFDGDHFDPITVGSPAWTLCVTALTRQLAG
jgi:acetyl esterase/lipase